MLAKSAAWENIESKITRNLNSHSIFTPLNMSQVDRLESTLTLKTVMIFFVFIKLLKAKGIFAFLLLNYLNGYSSFLKLLRATTDPNPGIIWFDNIFSIYVYKWN